MNQLIVDKDGEWFSNVGLFPFIDPTTNTRFEPGVQVKIKSNDWIKGQPVLVKQVDEGEPTKPVKSGK